MLVGPYHRPCKPSKVGAETAPGFAISAGSQQRFLRRPFLLFIILSRISQGGSMQPIAFCNRCRGMKVGWNRRYILHSLLCRELISKSYKLLALTVVLSSFIFAFPISTEVVLSNVPAEQVRSVAQASFVPLPALTVDAIERLLSRYGVDSKLKNRVAQAIVASARKHNVEPRLVA